MITTEGDKVYKSDDYNIILDAVAEVKRHGVLRKNRRYYYSSFATMDIETSKIPAGIDEKKGETHYEAITYSIALYIGGYCILSRTWDEYNKLIVRLTELLNISNKQTLVIYVHNLPYEFQFMRNFMKIEEVFATAPRKVVKCLGDMFEYRCSYKLTNMGLARFCESIPPEYMHHYKKSGEDFDYSIIRLPNTELSSDELQYIYNDVAGLHEAITYQLLSEKDTIVSIPLTSTGYILC